MGAAGSCSDISPRAPSIVRATTAQQTLLITANVLLWSCLLPESSPRPLMVYQAAGEAVPTGCRVLCSEMDSTETPSPSLWIRIKITGQAAGTVLPLKYLTWPRETHLWIRHFEFPACQNNDTNIIFHSRVSWISVSRSLTQNSQSSWSWNVKELSRRSFQRTALLKQWMKTSESFKEFEELESWDSWHGCSLLHTSFNSFLCT